MLHELKMISLKKNALLIIILFIVFLGIMGTAFFSGGHVLLGGKLNLDNLSNDQIYPEKYVTAGIYGVYGNYASTTEYSDDTSKVLEAEYIIGVGEDKYMGLVIPENLLAKAETLAEESKKYLDGELEEISGQFRVSGTIAHMAPDSLYYYHNYCGYLNLTKEQRTHLLPYYLKVNYIGDIPSAVFVCMAVIAFFFLAISLFCLISLLTGIQQKPITKYCQKPGSLKKIEKFYRAVKPVHGLRANTEYILGMETGGKSVFLPTGNLLRAYKCVKRFRLDFILPAGKTWAVAFRTKDGKVQYHHVKNEAQAQEILDIVRSFSDDQTRKSARRRGSIR